MSDLDECYENPRICLSGRCENTPGSYKCTCLDGFTPSIDQAFCVDRDECVDTGMCENGHCLNMDGSFKCVCNPGFRLGPTGKHCIGMYDSNLVLLFIIIHFISTYDVTDDVILSFIHRHQ